MSGQFEGLDLATIAGTQETASIPAAPIVPSTTERYQLKAREVLIQPVDGGDFLATDGIEYTQWGDEKRKFSLANEDSVVEIRLGQVGTYDSNNSTLAYVDENGVMHVGHSTDENFQALEKAGYRRGSIWVPFSNGEVPSDPDTQKRYIELRETGRELNRQRNIREHLRIYSQEAERKKIQPIEGGLFMMVDGIEYQQFGTNTAQVETNTDGYNLPRQRVDQVGTFDSNNGRIAFVDEKGRMWVGASTSGNWEALQKAKYQRGGIWVPFSNGEVPTDRPTYEQLRDVLTGKPAEQLQAERNARVEEVISNRIKIFGEIAVIPDRKALFSRVADRAERDYVNTEALVKEKLQPRLEQDNGGFTRKIYTLNGKTFTFKGKEELPVYSTMNSSQTHMLGEDPNWIESQEYQRYKSQLEITQIQSGAQEHFVVNKTVIGVIDLAIAMGSIDSSLPIVRDEIRRGEYSERALTLIDALVASNYIDYSGFGNRPDTDAEAVVLLSLLGDSQAQTAVAEAVETMRKIDNEKVKISNPESEEEPLHPQDLCVVHATRYMPKVEEDGFLVGTTFDATGGKVLRNSVHTALNHKVAGHMYGSWGDAGYVLISPFESMIRANGTPAVLNTVDTYWTANPGQQIKFADGTLVAPGGSDVKGLFEFRDGNEVVFKSEGLDTSDLSELTRYASERGSLGRFSADIDSALSGALHPYGSAMELSDQWELGTTLKAINQYLYQDDNGWGHQPALLNILTSIDPTQTPRNLEDRIRQIIIDSGAINGLKAEVPNRELAVDHLAKTLSDRIRSTMFTEINELTVQEVISKKGFTVQPGGMWAWGNSWSVTARTGLLGQSMGVPVGAHTNMPDHALTERFIGGVRQASQTERGETHPFDWKKFDTKFDDLVSQVDPKSRRVLYASGLLTART